MSASRRIATAGLIVTGAYLASRLLGWVRLAVISTTFGAGSELDAFFAAFRIPDLVFQLVAAGALSSALIPVLAGLHAHGEDARAWRVASTVANIVLVALALLAGLFAVGAPLLVPLVTPGFDAATTERTVELTRLMLAGPLLLALSAVATSVLNARGRFAAAAAAPVAYNLAIIGAALLLAPALGVEALAVGVVVGSFLTLLVQILPLARAGFRYRPAVDAADPAAREVLVLMAPRAVGLGASQVTLIALTTLASGLPVGSVTALNVAFTLLQLPIGVIGVPLGIVVFPSLARELATGAVAAYAALLLRALRLVVVAMLPIAAIGAVLRTELVTLLFGYGRFDAAAIELTAGTFLPFLAGLPAHALIAILARAFYADKETRIPALAACVSVVVNVGFAVVTVGSLGLAALALAIAIGAWVETAVLVALLRRRIPGLELGGLVGVALRAGIAAAGGAALAFGTVSQLAPAFGAPATVEADRLGLLAVTAVAGGAGLVGFAALARALRIPELATIVGAMADVLRRRS
ncbi:MAG: hypothetical protein RL338_14 [Chloroflexota bacterium]